MKEKILFVDDEQSILSSVKRLLRKENYSVHVANSGQAGLEFIKENPEVSVIISDMRMPEMDGVAFLKEAKKFCPKAVTAILSGYADSESIMAAVNEGDVWRYLKKPWEDNELKICVKNAIEMHVAERERQELLVSLEEKVKDRTWELQAKTELLDMVITDVPLEKFLSHALEIVIKMTQAKAGSILVSFQEMKLVQGDFSDLSESEILTKKALENNATVGQKHCVAIPLTKADHVLGVLAFEFDKAVEKDAITALLGGFLVVIVLALSQHKTLCDAPNLIKKVDKLIDGLA